MHLGGKLLGIETKKATKFIPLNMASIPVYFGANAPLRPFEILILGSVETHFQGRGRIREILELAGLLLVAGGRG